MNVSVMRYLTDPLFFRLFCEDSHFLINYVWAENDCIWISDKMVMQAL